MGFQLLKSPATGLWISLVLYIPLSMIKPGLTTKMVPEASWGRKGPCFEAIGKVGKSIHLADLLLSIFSEELRNCVKDGIHLVWFKDLPFLCW